MAEAGNHLVLNNDDLNYITQGLHELVKEAQNRGIPVMLFCSMLDQQKFNLQLEINRQLTPKIIVGGR